MANRETAVEPSDLSVATFYYRKKGPRSGGDPYGVKKLELLIPKGAEVRWRQGKQYRRAGYPNLSIVVDGRPVNLNTVDGDDDEGEGLEDADLAELEAQKAELRGEIAALKSEKAELRGQLQSLEELMERTRKTWATEQESHSEMLNIMRRQFAEGHGVMQEAFLKQVETSKALETTMAGRVKAADGNLVDAINREAKLLNEVGEVMEKVRSKMEGPVWRQVLDDLAGRVERVDQSDTGQLLRFLIMQKTGIDPEAFFRAKEAAARAAAAEAGKA